MSQDRMFAPAETKSSPKTTSKKEIASINIKPNVAIECYPELYYVTVSYKDGTKEKNEMCGGSIWKKYFPYLNKEDQKLFTREVYEEEHGFLPREDQERGLSTEPTLLTLEELEGCFSESSQATISPRSR